MIVIVYIWSLFLFIRLRVTNLLMGVWVKNLLTLRYPIRHIAVFGWVLDKYRGPRFLATDLEKVRFIVDGLIYEE